MNYLFLIFKITTIYFTLILLLRILGKREVGELSIFDLVVVLIIADVASLGIDNDDFFIPSFICLGVLVILQKILTYVLFHNAKYRSLIDGNPTIIVKNGSLLIDNMKKEHYTIDDLISQMRLEHIMDINEIKLAILETNGTLSVFRESKFDDLRLVVVSSGNIILDNLEILKIDKTDIITILNDNKLELKNVLYASYGDGIFYYFYLDDNKVKELECKTIRLL